MVMNWWQTIVAYVIIISVFYYVLFVMPRQAEEKKHNQMIEELKVGDSVVTIGGLCGNIHAVTWHTFLLEVFPGIIVEISKDSVDHVREVEKYFAE
jgi:preprotein translocase subunit YajC